MRIPAVLAGTLCLLAVASAAPPGPPDQFAPERRELLEHEVLAELSRLREDRGIAPIVWDERLALVMRDHVAALLRTGWAGGPPTGLKATQRAQVNHRYAVEEVLDNYSPQLRKDWTPGKVATALIEAQIMAAFRDSAFRIGCAVVVEKGDAVYSCVCVLPGDPAPVVAAEDRAAAAWLAVAGATAPAGRAEALLAHLPLPAAAFPWLARTLATEKEPAVRAAAATALGGLGTPSVVPPLLASLADKSPEVRDAAGKALAAATGQSRADGKAWTAWWAGARETFAVPVPTAPAAPAVPPELDPAAVLGGYKRMSVEKDPVLRALACRGAAVGAAGKAAAPLAALLADADPAVRVAAAEALARGADESVVPKMTKAWSAMRDEPRALLALVRALGATGSAKALPTLVATPFDPPSQAVVTARCAALGQIKEKKAIETLIAWLPELPNRAGEAAAAAAGASLRTLTSATPGDTPGAWTDWWRANKATFKFPEPPPPDPPAAPPAAPPAPPAGG